MSCVVETMSERDAVVCDLRHAVVVNERRSDDTHVEYLMTLKLHQQHQHQHHNNNNKAILRNFLKRILLFI